LLYYGQFSNLRDFIVDHVEIQIRLSFSQRPYRDEAFAKSAQLRNRYILIVMDPLEGASACLTSITARALAAS
jgi:hypothetical protein